MQFLNCFVEFISVKNSFIFRVKLTVVLQSGLFKSIIARLNVILSSLFWNSDTAHFTVKNFKRNKTKLIAGLINTYYVATVFIICFLFYAHKVMIMSLKIQIMQNLRIELAKPVLNPLSTKPTKWSNTLKQLLECV